MNAEWIGRGLSPAGAGEVRNAKLAGVKSLVQENVPLAPFTTLGIGGPARYFIQAHSENTVVDAVHQAKERELPFFVLGRGSNLLVSDVGFPGVVIRIGLTGVEREPQGQRTIVRAQAGEEWDRLVASCVKEGLAGIECLSGIPGSVGGTPVQNVGAYGQEVSDAITAVRAYDSFRDAVAELSAAECGFSYRSSIFNTIARDRYIVFSVTYSLLNGGPAAVRYGDVLRAFENTTGQPSLADVREAVRRIRASKAMLLVEGDPDCRSAGSFFKNPIVSERKFRELQAMIPTEHVPGRPVPPRAVKTPAAWLIERAGFSKGFSVGRAGLSSRHTLAIVNKGGATAVEVLNLARRIRDGVENRFGIRLVPEPVFLGFDDSTVSEFFSP